MITQLEHAAGFADVNVLDARENVTLPLMEIPTSKPRLPGGLYRAPVIIVYVAAMTGGCAVCVAAWAAVCVVTRQLSLARCANVISRQADPPYSASTIFTTCRIGSEPAS